MVFTAQGNAIAVSFEVCKIDEIGGLGYAGWQVVDGARELVRPGDWRCFIGHCIVAIDKRCPLQDALGAGISQTHGDNARHIVDGDVGCCNTCFFNKRR